MFGYKGKVSQMSGVSPRHRTTIAHFLNHGDWEEEVLPREKPPTAIRCRAPEQRELRNGGHRNACRDEAVRRVVESRANHSPGIDSERVAEIRAEREEHPVQVKAEHVLVRPANPPVIVSRAVRRHGIGIRPVGGLRLKPEER